MGVIQSWGGKASDAGKDNVSGWKEDVADVGKGRVTPLIHRTLGAGMSPAEHERNSKRIGDALGQLGGGKKGIPEVYQPVSPANVEGPGVPGQGGVPGQQMTVANVADPRAVLINTQPQQEFRDQQSALARQLAGQAAGTGPSVAQNQLRQGQEANIAATMALMNSQRGQPNPGMARQAMQTSAQIQGKAAQEAATARLQEQMQAAGMLNNVAGSARGQDIGLAESQANLQQQSEMARYQATVQQAQQNAQLGAQFQDLQSKYAAMGMSAAQANQQAALEIERIKAGQSQAANAAAQAEKARQSQFLGTVLQTGGTLAGAYFGGPAGAAAGGAAGKAVGDGVSK
jgi:hypothetical protein